MTEMRHRVRGPATPIQFDWVPSIQDQAEGHLELRSKGRSLLDPTVHPPTIDKDPDMPKSNLDVHLRTRIDGFVEEISALVRAAAVEAVQEAFTNGAPGRRSPKRKARKKAAKKSGKRVRRSAAQVDVLAAGALAAIKRKPGRRLGEIAKEIRSTTKDVRRPVQTLLDEKKVRTTGQRGGTRYFPATGRKKKAAKKRTAKRKTKKGATPKRKATKGTAKRKAKKRAAKRKTKKGAPPKRKTTKGTAKQKAKKPAAKPEAKKPAVKPETNEASRQAEYHEGKDPERDQLG